MSTTNFKRCCGCDSVVGAHKSLCPHCHAYRFEPVPTEPEGDTIAEWDNEWVKELHNTLGLFSPDK